MTDPFDAAEQILGIVAAGVSSPPARQYVTFGTPAHDCDFLAVSVERLYQYSGNVVAEALQGVMTHPGASMRAGTFGIHLIRCVPTLTPSGQPPSAADLSDSANTILDDAQLVWAALVAARKAGEFPCSDLAFDSWSAVTPAGGLGGGLTRVRVGLA